MKYIGYNIIPIILLIIYGYTIYSDKPNYEWLIIAAVIFAVYPISEDKNKD